MSEYQYYEFAAVDRPLDAAARAALREISSRARITATSFVNSYDWGDLKADPMALLERYFDLFVYVANWGTRRFALRIPSRFLTAAEIEPFNLDEEIATVRAARRHVIVDICLNEEAPEEWDDGSGWLQALSPLRAALIEGDLRLFSLLWLVQVDLGLIADEAVEPLPALAPLSEALGALAEFLGLDGDLLDAAAQAGPAAESSEEETLAVLRALPEEEKVALLFRLQAGDSPHLGAELRRRCRAARAPASRSAGRTAGELREAARRLGEERRRRAEAQEAAERRRREEEERKARARHLAALARRGEAVWREVEDLVAARNAFAYDKAAAIVADLGEIAGKTGEGDAFARRLADLRLRHERKAKFIERLDAADAREGRCAGVSGAMGEGEEAVALYGDWHAPRHRAL
jgi:hypothetical protein